MRYGRPAARLRPHDAVRSSRAPSVASEHPCPCRPLRAGAPRQSPSGVRRERHRGCAHGAASATQSTVLTEAEEAVVVEFRRRTLLPLDDVLGCLRESVPGSPAAPCTAAWNGTASPACPETRRLPPSASASPRPGSATSTSTAASCAPPKARSTCSSPSIASPSSPTSSCTRRLRWPRVPPSCAGWWPPSPTASILC